MYLLYKIHTIQENSKFSYTALIFLKLLDLNANSQARSETTFPSLNWICIPNGIWVHIPKLDLDPHSQAGPGSRSQD
jgi:hypothetical protein